MSLQARTMSRRTAVSLVLALLGASIAACTLITGASDLAPCSGPSCIDSATGGDGSSPPSDGARDDDASTPGQHVTPDGATSLDSGRESGSGCPLCDGGECCAPSTCVVATGICGACSSGGGPCQVDGDCCSGLKCSTYGKCVSSCRQEYQDCSVGSCCLGTRCSLLGGLMCAPCGLDGTSCNSGGTCCSNSCVGNVCVGNVSPGPGM